MYQQGGWIDRWPQANTYTNVMCGSPLTTVAATAWNAGLRDFDMASLYPGMLKDATQSPPPEQALRRRGQCIAYMDQMGYIPDDKEGYGSVSQTEEDCIAYAALASMAASLGKTQDAAYFTKRVLVLPQLVRPRNQVPAPETRRRLLVQAPSIPPKSMAMSKAPAGITAGWPRRMSAA